MQPETKRVPLLIKDCPVASATVYVDRAEVTRTVPFDVEGAGQYSVIISGLTESADTDSIRVKIMGDSACTIQEVSFDIVHIPIDVTEPRAALADAQSRRKALQCEIERLSQRDSMVQQYMQAMLNATKPAEKGAALAGPAAGTDLATVTKLLDFHQGQGAANDKQMAELAEKVELVEAEVCAAEKELGKLQSPYGRFGLRVA